MQNVPLFQLHGFKMTETDINKTETTDSRRRILIKNFIARNLIQLICLNEINSRTGNRVFYE